MLAVGIITIRNSSCGKVLFSQECICSQVGWSGMPDPGSLSFPEGAGISEVGSGTPEGRNGLGWVY